MGKVRVVPPGASRLYQNRRLAPPFAQTVARWKVSQRFPGEPTMAVQCTEWMFYSEDKMR